MSRPEWFPDWTGETCVIVGSGPSASSAPIDIVKGKAKVIATNTSWKLAPWADALMACDYAWWAHAKGCPEFQGLKLTVDQIAARTFEDVRLVNCRKGDDRLFLEPINTVGWGGNSGFHALNLAVQFGCSKIILVGIDASVKHGLHWHGTHPRGLNNPTSGNVERWRRAIDRAWTVIEPLGIKVINCSTISALTAYPKMTLQEALDA
ncbi:hypothetical protein GCM10007908_03650 [Rhizobium albus]|nr:hypothetical protein GCM10007908_03650 [Rhizobium albus]